MDSTPIYVVIGSILGIVSAVIISIWHFPQVIGIIKSFFRWLPKQIRICISKYNKWRWWRPYRPSLRLISKKDLEIKFDGQRYHLTLEVTLECKNNSDRYMISGYTFYRIRLHHKGKGWERRPYELEIKDTNPHISNLKQRDSRPVILIFECVMSEKPIFGKTTICEFRGNPTAHIESSPSIPLEGKMKKKWPGKFKVNVIWK